MTPTPDPAEALAREAVADGHDVDCDSLGLGSACDCGWARRQDVLKHKALARAYLAQSERLRAAEGLLREVEWAGRDYIGAPMCPVCHAPRSIFKSERAHRDACALAAHLACQPAREAT